MHYKKKNRPDLLAQDRAETITAGAMVLIRAIILYHNPLKFSSIEYQGIFAPFLKQKECITL
jgi:hypothetical protein